MIKNNYQYSKTYTDIEQFKPTPNSVYIYSYSTEGRSHFVDRLLEVRSENVDFIAIQESTEKDKFLSIKNSKSYSLKKAKDIRCFLQNFNLKTIYIDTSGLSNRVSSALLKQILGKNISDLKFKDIYVIYTEPHKYNIASFKSEGVYHDLSERINGIAPLPGFANIFPNDNDDFKLVALLGFEGGRFTHVLENIQPASENIIPVIGIPGFRVEYPFVALWGNRRPLLSNDAWRNTKYVQANSIIDCYIYLKKLAEKAELENKLLKIAPIGTKPHAIGAILCAIKFFKNVELVYDNPIRKKKRTHGIGKVTVSNVSKLLKDN